MEVWATWLDDKQLARMHETEGLSAGVYGLLELQQINLRFDSGAEWTTALAYVQRHGSLNLGGQPTALQEIPALNRNFQALSQRQLQLILRDRFAPAASLDRFIQENLENPSIRQARAKALRETAISFDWPHIQDRTPISLWRG